MPEHTFSSPPGRDADAVAWAKWMITFFGEFLAVCARAAMPVDAGDALLDTVCETALQEHSFSEDLAPSVVRTIAPSLVVEAYHAIRKFADAKPFRPGTLAVSTAKRLLELKSTILSGSNTDLRWLRDYRNHIAGELKGMKAPSALLAAYDFSPADDLLTRLLKRIGAAESWRLRDLPELNIDLLRLMDENGWIEIHLWERPLISRPLHDAVYGEPARARHEHWFSPIRQPAFAGTWDDIFKAYSEPELSPEIRLTQRGQAKLTAGELESRLVMSHPGIDFPPDVFPAAQLAAQAARELVFVIRRDRQALLAAFNSAKVESWIDDIERCSAMSWSFELAPGETRMDYRNRFVVAGRALTNVLSNLITAPQTPRSVSDAAARLVVLFKDVEARISRWTSLDPHAGRSDELPSSATAQSRPLPPAQKQVIDAPRRDEQHLPNLQPHDRRAYQLSLLDGMTQKAIAEALNKEYGTTYDQGQVSRMIKRAMQHAKASGLSDLLRAPAAPPRATDPDILELGARTDHLTPRQRPKGDRD